jgi:hypothetical protein
MRVIQINLNVSQNNQIKFSLQIQLALKISKTVNFSTSMAAERTSKIWQPSASLSGEKEKIPHR